MHVCEAMFRRGKDVTRTDVFARLGDTVRLDDGITVTTITAQEPMSVWRTIAILERARADRRNITASIRGLLRHRPNSTTL